jgi:hypothetical protein
MLKPILSIFRLRLCPTNSSTLSLFSRKLGTDAAVGDGSESSDGHSRNKHNNEFDCIQTPAAAICSSSPKAEQTSKRNVWLQNVKLSRSLTP